MTGDAVSSSWCCRTWTLRTGLRAGCRVRPAHPDAKRPTSSRLRPFWRGAFSGIGVTAIAAGVVFFFLAPPNNPLLDDLVNAHVAHIR
jgi:hypothetical protein